MKILASRRFPGSAWGELTDVDYLPEPLPEGAGRRRDDVEALAIVGERIDDETLDLFPSVRDGAPADTPVFTSIPGFRQGMPLAFRRHT